MYSNIQVYIFPYICVRKEHVHICTYILSNILLLYYQNAFFPSRDQLNNYLYFLPLHYGLIFLFLLLKTTEFQNVSAVQANVHKNWNGRTSLVVQTLCSQSKGPEFDPWSGNQIPHAATKTQCIQINIFFKRTGMDSVLYANKKETFSKKIILK